MEEIKANQPLTPHQKAFVAEVLQFYKTLSRKITKDDVQQINDYQHRKDILLYPKLHQALKFYEPLLKENVERYNDADAKNDLNTLKEVKVLAPKVEKDFKEEKQKEAEL